MWNTPAKRTHQPGVGAHVAVQAVSRVRESASGPSPAASRSMSVDEFRPTSWPSTKPLTSLTSGVSARLARLSPRDPLARDSLGLDAVAAARWLAGGVPGRLGLPAKTPVTRPFASG